MPAMFPLAGGKQLCVPPWRMPLILLEEVCSLHKVSSWGWTWEGTWKWKGFLVWTRKDFLEDLGVVTPVSWWEHRKEPQDKRGLWITTE